MDIFKFPCQYTEVSGQFRYILKAWIKGVARPQHTPYGSVRNRNIVIEEMKINRKPEPGT